MTGIARLSLTDLDPVGHPFCLVLAE